MPKSETTSEDLPKATRNSQVVLTTPPTVAAMVSAIRPALERVTANAGVQLLVLVPDADAALDVARAVLPAGDAAAVLVPVTSAARGARLLARTPSALIGAPSDLAALLPSGQLKLSAVQQLFVLQADLTLALTDDAAMTALMTELPKDIARTVTVAAETEDVTAFAKAYMKRPRRVGDEVVAGRSGPITLQYVLVTDATRASTLRRVLDAVNAPSAIVVATDAVQVGDAQGALRALGYDMNGGDVTVATGAVEVHSVLRVLFDVPATRAALDAALGGQPVQTIALVTPRQVAHLRALLGGGSLTLFMLPDVMAQAVGRDGARVGELRKILADGVSARELAALEPLLVDNDPLEVAAAALRLLEREREMAKSLRIGVTTAQPKDVKRAVAAIADAESPVVPVESAAPSAPVDVVGRSSDAPTPEFQVLWFNVGSADGATASSFVGAITGETGLDRSVVGTIDLRDSHTLVEVSGAVAEQIVKAMNGSTMRNRDVIARIDRVGPLRASARGGAPRRGAGERSGGGFSRDRGDRPQRPSFRRDDGDAPRERSSYPRRDGGDRPSRPSFARDGGFSRPRDGGFPRDERPAREGGFSRPPRDGGFAREERAARPPRSGGFARDERPARSPRDGGFAREDRGSRPPRTGGFSRDERPSRPAGGGFSRGPRDAGPRDAGAQGGRGFTRDRSDRPFGSRGESNDFAERAERLRTPSHAAHRGLTPVSDGFVTSSGGWIEVIAGVMFSGKSEELMRRVRRATIARKRVQVFKSHLDDRYGGVYTVSSHDGRDLEAIPVDSASQIAQQLDPTAQVVAVDEVQFLDAGIIALATALAEGGRRVVLAGIDTDFRGEPFGAMPQLMAVAEQVTKLHAICVLCGNPASRNQRLIDGKAARWDSPTIMVGAAQSYEARCRACHRVERDDADQVPLF